jgi:hypothetical protein
LNGFDLKKESLETGKSIFPGEFYMAVGFDMKEGRQ